MEHTGPEVQACWHCGAPLRKGQRLCLTCGASAECRPQDFSPIALEEILGRGYHPVERVVEPAQPAAPAPAKVPAAVG